MRLAALLAVLTLTLRAGAAEPAPPSPAVKRLAVTMDDVVLNGPPLSLKETRAVNDRITRKFSKAGVPAIGFVNEKRLYVDGEVDARIALLRMWLDRGLDLGNHTFSHPNLRTTPPDQYEADVIRGETVTSRLLAEKGRKLEYFRYPYLGTGSTKEVKAEIRDFLAKRGYRNAPVTVDPSDWMFSAVYTKAKLAGDKKTMARVVATYLAYARAAFAFSEKTALDVAGRPIPQVLMLHCNPLNADHLDELLGQIREDGYAFVRLGDALADPAYSMPDDYVGDDGTLWQLRWRVAQGKPALGEDDFPKIPPFIEELYEGAHYED